MNQILSIKLKKNTNQFFEKKKWFKFQFVFSILIITILISFSIYYIYNLVKKERISNNLVSNYNIYKLYNSNLSENENSYNQISFNNLFGIIDIPKINVYYPVFSHLTEDLLRVAPCKFYGNTLNEYGNICIAGHNYDNSLFFSKINTLLKNDEILIYDNNGNKYIYLVYNIYEVEESDFSPILNYDKNEKILTLITCNNINSNRIILKAKQTV